MGRKPTKPFRFNARLSQEARDILERLAEQTGMEKTALVEEALRLLDKRGTASPYRAMQTAEERAPYGEGGEKER